MMVGEIRRGLPWAGGIPNTARCSGQLLLITQYQALYSVIGNRFGGDGRQYFALPDLRSEPGPAYYIALSGTYPRYA